MDSIFGPVFDVIGFFLAGIYSVIPNLGVAIILLTIGIFLVLYPLTAKQTRSMLAMQAVQPEIKKLQAKYKNDRQKLNEETMKFYQENKINPLSGCLPLLAQMPVLISLFSVLRNAYKYVPSSSKLYSDLCDGLGKLGVDSEGTKDVNAWSKCGVKATRSLIEQYKPSGVVKADPLLHHQHFLGLDLQKAATAAHDGFLNALPYFILVGLVIISYVVSTRQSQKRTPAANKQMGTVMKILPPFFGLISITLPSGVVLYLFTSSVFRVIQQGVIFNRHGHILTSRKPAVDVKSAERPPPEAPALRERTRPARPRPPRAAVERSAAPAPLSGALPGDDEKPRGIRGLFQLPPPPESNGGNGSERSSANGGGEITAGGSSSANPAASNRRRRNKKRKR
jgi:YidC/Oxa1 family membrane protein insertase